MTERITFEPFFGPSEVTLLGVRKAILESDFFLFHFKDLGVFIVQRLRGGGKTYRVNLGGGGNALQSVLSKTLLEASEIGVGVVGASFF